MGVAGDWKPRYRVTAALVIAKDQTGHLRHCYKRSLLGWLSDEQAQHFLHHNLVARIDDGADIAELPAAETVAECVQALNRLGVELKAGAPRARTALREAGRKFSNQTVAAAVRQRKLALTQRRGHDEEFEEIVAG
ncbi:hypothetical protein [Mycobacterium colombiense]|uniref:hypothetical protein n=1 Tax=Mycobacterium colombiense TaxID=339268 RepID=UPI00096CCB84|nr:hypothetical protein [Mycobacterium colombiense]OMB93217.1 hypothetical protein A5732_16840 [Mycobacterium colombiense]